MTDVVTPAPAASAPLKAGRLLIAAIIVAPLASILGSLITGAVLALMVGTNAGDAVFASLFVAAVATLVSFLFVLGALLVVVLPLTLMLAGSAPRTRNLVLIGIAAGLCALLWPLSINFYSGEGWIFPVYALTTAILWVLALNRLDRRT